MNRNQIKLMKPPVTMAAYLTPQSSSAPEGRKILKIILYSEKRKIKYILLVLKYQSIPYLINRNYHTKSIIKLNDFLISHQALLEASFKKQRTKGTVKYVGYFLISKTVSPTNFVSHKGHSYLSQNVAHP